MEQKMTLWFKIQSLLDMIKYKPSASIPLSVPLIDHYRIKDLLSYKRLSQRLSFIEL